MCFNTNFLPKIRTAKVQNFLIQKTLIKINFFRTFAKNISHVNKGKPRNETL